MLEVLDLLPQLGFLVGLGIAWGDLRRKLSAQDEITKDGFKQVNTRLDKVNGRIDRGEDRLQNHGERIAKLEG